MNCPVQYVNDMRIFYLIHNDLQQTTKMVSVTNRQIGLEPKTTEVNTYRDSISQLFQSFSRAQTPSHNTHHALDAFFHLFAKSSKYVECVKLNRPKKLSND